MLINNYPDQAAAIQIHRGDGYEVPWGTARATYFGVPGTPDTWVDGLLRHYGSLGYDWQDYNYLRDLMNQRLAEPCNVSVEVGADQVNYRTWRITVRMTLDPAAPSVDVRLHIIQALDHFPAFSTHFRNTAMQGAAAMYFKLNPGIPEVRQVEMTFDTTSWDNQEDMRLFAWVEEQAVTGPAEVFQAGKASWPFPSLDCNLNGITDDVDIAEGNSEDLNGNGIPDECEVFVPCLEDLAAPAGVEQQDLVAVLNRWGDPACLIGGANYPCPEDLAAPDGVEQQDLVAVLNRWGDPTCEPPANRDESDPPSDGSGRWGTSSTR